MPRNYDRREILHLAGGAILGSTLSGVGFGADGVVPGLLNRYGWLAAGVPGKLAWKQLNLYRYSTRPFSQLVQPALRYASDGIPITAPLAAAFRAADEQLRKDPGSAKLFLPK